VGTALSDVTLEPVSYIGEGFKPSPVPEMVFVEEGFKPSRKNSGKNERLILILMVIYT
jgi:hypothetical protein